VFGRGVGFGEELGEGGEALGAGGGVGFEALAVNLAEASQSVLVEIIERIGRLVWRGRMVTLRLEVAMAA